MLDERKIDDALRFLSELRQLYELGRGPSLTVVKSTDEVEKQILKTMVQIDAYLSQEP